MKIRHRTPRVSLSRRKIHELKEAITADRDVATDQEWMPERRGEQVVYFIQIADAPESPIKIGYTTGSALEERLGCLQVGCPYRLRILGTMRGGPDTEARLHESFAHANVHGEWFRPTDALLALVDGLPNSVRTERPLDSQKD